MKKRKAKSEKSKNVKREKAKAREERNDADCSFKVGPRSGRKGNENEARTRQEWRERRQKGKNIDLRRSLLQKIYFLGTC